MSHVPDRFPAFVAERTGKDQVQRGLRELTPADLPDGQVTIAVAWSSVNYKDALATTPQGRVARISPLVPGIDLAGEVVASGVEDVAVGDRVVVHGYGLGVSHHGGYAGFARVPADWVVPLPEGLDLREAMAIGTAGFTAALCVQRLEDIGLAPDDGPVLVTGATGGVGSSAVAILGGRGYEVVASTGKPDAEAWLRSLGAAAVLPREEVTGDDARPLRAERWAGAIDVVGGATLAGILSTLRYGAAVAACGLTGGAGLQTAVFPFILRGVSLLGVDSVQVGIADRRALWQRLARDLRPRRLDEMTVEIGLDELESTLDAILSGQVRGRTVVRVAA